MRKHRIVQVVVVLLYIVALLFLLAGILAAVALGGSGLGAGWGPGSRLPVVVPIVAIALFNAILFMVLASALFFLAKIENNLSVARNRRQSGTSGRQTVTQMVSPSAIRSITQSGIAGAPAAVSAPAVVATGAVATSAALAAQAVEPVEPEMAPAPVNAGAPVADQSPSGTLPWEAAPANVSSTGTEPGSAQDVTMGETPAEQPVQPLSDASVAALVSSADEALVPDTPAAALLAAAAAVPLSVPADDETTPAAVPAILDAPDAAEAWGMVSPSASEETGGPVTVYEAPEWSPVATPTAVEGETGVYGDVAAVAPAGTPEAGDEAEAGDDLSPFTPDVAVEPAVDEAAAAAEPEIAGALSEPELETLAPPAVQVPQVEIDDFEWEDSATDLPPAETPPPAPASDFASRLPGAGEVARIAAENRRAKNAARKVPPGDPEAGR